MTHLNKVKFMTEDKYSVDIDTEDSMCAVDIPELVGGGLFPDWSKRIELTSDTNYTVGSGLLSGHKLGYIWHSRTSLGDNNFQCTINGIMFWGGWWNGDTGADAKVIVFPVSEGDVVKCKSGVNRLFIPVKWEL